MGFLQIKRYAIGNGMLHVFTVQYNIYKSWHPKLVRFGAHPSTLCVITEITLLVSLLC